jgi:hypothetical protein
LKLILQEFECLCPYWLFRMIINKMHKSTKFI